MRGKGADGKRREGRPIFMYAVGSVWVRGLVTGAKAGHSCNLPHPSPALSSAWVYIRYLADSG